MGVSHFNLISTALKKVKLYPRVLSGIRLYLSSDDTESKFYFQDGSKAYSC